MNLLTGVTYRFDKQLEMMRSNPVYCTYALPRHLPCQTTEPFCIFKSSVFPRFSQLGMALLRFIVANLHILVC